MTTADEQPVLLDLFEDDGYAVITLNRPAKRNALTTRLMADLLAMLEGLRANERIGVIVLKGAGDRAFCSGQDLHDMRERRPGSLRPWGDAQPLGAIMECLREHPKVIIASVRGYCLGAGLALLAASDLAVASETAQIGMPEIIRGSFGQLATAALFHAGVPLKKAFYIQLTGRNLTGREAEQVGLVSVAVPDDEVEHATTELARLVAGHNHRALEHGKLTAYLGLEVGLRSATKLDWLAGARLRLFTDPLAGAGEYLRSQQGGPNPGYRRRDQA